ncbi:hypothetical protein [Erwinia sp. E_sp_W01_1]|uniref:hypothetical protein n=1 Tax=Erwinia sp. E_sp_W01_1 TaxID=3039407 RepID=UPI0030D31244
MSQQGDFIGNHGENLRNKVQKVFKKIRWQQIEINHAGQSPRSLIFTGSNLNEMFRVLFKSGVALQASEQRVAVSGYLQRRNEKLT